MLPLDPVIKERQWFLRILGGHDIIGVTISCRHLLASWWVVAYTIHCLHSLTEFRTI